MTAPQDSAHAIGDVYARALLEAASEAGQTDEVAEEFADLVAYMEREPEFAAFMTAMTVDGEVRRSSLDRLFRGKMNDLLLNTLQVLNNRNRPDVVRAVYDRFRILLQEQRGQIEVSVLTAVPPSEDMRETISSFLSRALGRDVILLVHVDPALLGGLVVQVGDRRFDASVAQRLRSLHRCLLDRASAEIHSRREYVTE